MKSGLEDRNNRVPAPTATGTASHCLNEVRPGRPEQSDELTKILNQAQTVSMKSGLEDRNNRQVEGLDDPRSKGSQ